jgi:hypothetical protein
MDAANDLPEKIVDIVIKLLLGLGVVGNSLALVAFAQQTNPHFIVFRAMTGAELLFCFLNLGASLLQRYCRNSKISKFALNFFSIRIEFFSISLFIIKSFRKPQYTVWVCIGLNCSV